MSRTTNNAIDHFNSEEAMAELYEQVDFDRALELLRQKGLRVTNAKGDLEVVSSTEYQSRMMRFGRN